MRKKEYKPLGYEKFVIMAIFERGSISLRDLEDITIVFISSIWYNVHYGKQYNILGRILLYLFHLRDRTWERYYAYRFKEKHIVKHGLRTVDTCNKLVEVGILKINDEKYELTENGMKIAQLNQKRFKKRAEMIENRLFAPSSAAINTTIVDGFMAFLKLSVGFITGSVGIISDGTDSATDTISAFLVWVGIKTKHESLSTLLVIVLLFVASITVMYESFSRLYVAWTSTLSPIIDPNLVIIIEVFAIFVYAGLFFYQRQIGRASGSLTLISQSVDSKNHIFIASSVAIGAGFSYFGIYYVDAIVGAVVAFRIFTDAIGLLKDAIHSIKGEETDLHKYKTPVENYVQDGKLKAFRIFTIFSVWARENEEKENIISSLETMYTQTYIPVLSELHLIPEDEYGFKTDFDKIMDPLIKRNFVSMKNGKYSITPSGIKRFKHFVALFRYYDVRLTDLFMLDIEHEED
ncbi:MAG: cation transporter [Methanobacterium sp.]|nr:cation transporter [Methanobacterium sp.]